MSVRLSYIITLSLLLFSSCENSDQTVANQTTTSATFVNKIDVSQDTPPEKKLDKYWFQGKGEINVYELQQNRYNAVHPGQAVLIFVTEDFLTDKQVKNDNYRNPNSTPILKTNFLNRFTTGLYDYSLMTSVFTPTNTCLLYTSPSPRDLSTSRMPSSA